MQKNMLFAVVMAGAGLYGCSQRDAVTPADEIPAETFTVLSSSQHRDSTPVPPAYLDSQARDINRFAVALYAKIGSRGRRCSNALPCGVRGVLLMPREPRLSVPDALVHVLSRGIGGRDIFRGEEGPSAVHARRAFIRQA